MTRLTPFVLKKEGTNGGFSPVYLSALVQTATKLYKRNLPVVFTLNHLSLLANVPYYDLRCVVNRERDAYRSFAIRKRSGGYRQIVAPDTYLLNVQSWIDQRILKNIEVHKSSTAYSTGCSPYQNAERHCNSKWLVKCDILRFFESIHISKVYNVFRSNGYPKLISFEMARLATREFVNLGFPEEPTAFEERIYKVYKSHKLNAADFLPQGAPTSPRLANIICYKMDNEIEDVASSFDCNYTRYSDDMTFSSFDFSRKEATRLIQAIDAILAKYGFMQNHRKTIVIPPGGKKIVTGLLVDGNTPKLAREFKERIKSHLYYTRKYGITDHCKAKGFRSINGFFNHLNGLITYCESVENKIGQAYREEFEAIPWPDFCRISIPEDN